MITYTNVSAVAASFLCNACGGCQWICPVSAIDYTETPAGLLVPEIDPKTCTQCGLCVSICPGIYLSQTLLSSLAGNPFEGNVIASYLTTTTDPDIFNNSQSGGAVTALLASSLMAGEIGGAVTVKMNPRVPTRIQVVLSKTKQELLSTQKSKYCPAPLLSILDEVKKIEKPVAIVGLPCHIHGLHNILETFPLIRKKIAYTIGLVCDRIMTYTAIDYLVRRGRVPLDSVSFFHFRDKRCDGYPGKVHFGSSNGVEVILPSKERTQIKNFFTPPRCRLCFDKLNVFADIVVGDPHGIYGFDRRSGASATILRTTRGKHIFDHAVKSQQIAAHEISFEQFAKGQAIKKKEKDWFGFQTAWRNLDLDRPLPNYCNILCRPARKKPFSYKSYKKMLNQAIETVCCEDKKTIFEKADQYLKIQKIYKLIRLPVLLVKKIFKLKK